jgi:ATP-dependent helicase/DNAse subunit B
MPLKLVTGPANSAKAGEVLGGYRERLEEEPILVVPAFPDVEHAQREMARSGAVFGAKVIRFAWLFAEIADRSSYAARTASRLQQQVVLEDALAGARLSGLAASAERPGFVSAARRFVQELERAMIEPQALAAALARWRGGPPYAAEIARVYSAYADGMGRLGLVSDELFAWRALDALGADPESFGRTPVFLYGFDDFTQLEMRAIELLAGPVGTDVVVSLPFEPGRDAFAAVESTFEGLRALADQHVELPPIADHYAPAARTTLHHLERSLFAAGGRRMDPDPAVRLHSAGGRRAEVELAGAAVLDLLAGGMPAGEIAVISRRPELYGTLFEQVFASYGIPFSAGRRVAFGRTALGRGILAMLRCAGAVPAPSADDLLAYLRTPGRLRQPGLADKLEYELRRQGIRAAAAARSAWDEEKAPLGELDELASAPAGRALLDRLEVVAERLFAGPYTRAAHVFEPDELDDPRVFAAVRSAIADLRALGNSVRIDLARVHDLLDGVEVYLGNDPQPDRVHVTEPRQVRARRFRAVLVLGLQEGEFPRPGRPDPFLPDDERRDLAHATGFELPEREEELERERYLFYVCASRAEERLILSWRTSDEQGGPEPESFFLEDVRDVLALPDRPHAVRDLAQVTWALDTAPTRVEWERAAAAALPAEAPRVPDGLHSQEVLAELAAREAWSASALEAAADCTVKWLVMRLLDPDALEPDAEQLVRGRFAHEVLRAVFERLAEPLTEQNLADAERHLIESIRNLQQQFPISPNKSRVRAAVRKLEFDLLRYLQHEARRGDSFRPTEFESKFMVDVGGLALRGLIDRVDRCGDWALVRDYKTGKRAYPVARWEEDRRLQVAVYLLALQAEHPELKLAGGVYQALGGDDLRPRGLLNSEAEGVLGEGWVSNDFRETTEFEAVLEHARETVEEVVTRLRSGDVRPCPTTCAYRGGCSYPAVCRSET